MFQKTTLVRNLFYTNILVFLATLIIPGLFNNLAVYPLDSPNFHFYQLVTSLFTHAGFLHIIFNMLALLSFGPQCEVELGRNKFLLLYFLSGFAGALLQLSFTTLPLVGASAAIFGLLVYSTLINPNQLVNIIFFPFISFKAKWLIGAVVLFEVYAVISGKQDGVGHFAHLGGAIIGLITFLSIKAKSIIK